MYASGVHTEVHAERGGCHAWRGLARRILLPLSWFPLRPGRAGHEWLAGAAQPARATALLSLTVADCGRRDGRWLRTELGARRLVRASASGCRMLSRSAIAVADPARSHPACRSLLQAGAA